MNNKVIDYNYLEDRYKNLFYYSTIENGINENNKKNINNFIGFINELLLMSSMKISSYQESDINPLVTGQIDHTIEPRNIGLSLINEALQVYKVRIYVFTADIFTHWTYEGSDYVVAINNKRKCRMC